MKRIIFLIMLTLSFAGVFAQSKVYLPFVDVVNIHQDYRLSVTRLFRTYLENTGRYQVILPTVFDTSLVYENPESTRETARNAGASMFIRGELNRVGETVIITFKLYEVSTGNIVWMDLLKANTPDDIDPVLMKVARNIGTPKKASLDTDIYSVSAYDSRELRKLNMSSYIGLNLGGVMPSIKDDNVLGSGLGGMISFDARDILIDVSGEMYFSRHDIYFASINASYPFFQSRHTPFAGGGLGWGTSNLDYNYRALSQKDRIVGYGLMLFANGGYYFNRNSSVGLRANLRFYYSLYDMDKEGDFQVNQQKRVIKNPYGLMFSLAILMGS